MILNLKLPKCKAKSLSTGKQCLHQAQPGSKFCSQHSKTKKSKITSTKKKSSTSGRRHITTARRATTMSQAEANLKYLRSLVKDYAAFDRLVDDKPKMGVKYFVPQKKLVVRAASAKDFTGRYVYGQFGLSNSLGIIYDIPETGTQHIAVVSGRPANAYISGGRLILGSTRDAVYKVVD